MSLVHPDDLERTTEYFTNITTITETSHEHKMITPKGNLKYIKDITWRFAIPMKPASYSV
jgi:two-component system sensor histidine kinase/response regulator